MKSSARKFAEKLSSKLRGTPVRTKGRAGNDNAQAGKLQHMIDAFNSVGDAIANEVARGKAIFASEERIPDRGHIDIKGDRAQCLKFLGKAQLFSIDELHRAFDRLDADVHANMKAYGATRAMQMLAVNDLERCRLSTLFKARQARFGEWATGSGYAESAAELQRLEKMHEALAGEIIAYPCRTMREVSTKAEFVNDILDGTMTAEETVRFLKSLTGGSDG